LRSILLWGCLTVKN